MDGQRRRGENVLCAKLSTIGLNRRKEEQTGGDKYCPSHASFCVTYGLSLAGLAGFVHIMT